MRLWLDDIRPMPADFDFHAKTAKDAINRLASHEVTFISFDHDLGAEENGTGYDVAKWIEANAAFQEQHRGMMDVPKWQIHSANVVGRKNITMAMESAERIKNRYEDTHLG